MVQNQILIDQEIPEATFPVTVKKRHEIKVENKTVDTKEADRENFLDRNILSDTVLPTVKITTYFTGDLILELKKNLSKRYYTEIQNKTNDELLKQKDIIKPKTVALSKTVYTII